MTKLTKVVVPWSLQGSTFPVHWSLILKDFFLLSSDILLSISVSNRYCCVNSYSSTQFFTQNTSLYLMVKLCTWVKILVRFSRNSNTVLPRNGISYHLTLNTTVPKTRDVFLRLIRTFPVVSTWKLSSQNCTFNFVH